MLGTCDRLSTFVAFYGPYKVDEGSPNKHCMHLLTTKTYRKPRKKFRGCGFFASEI